jgi:uncharacterized protein (UPF0333 family)
MKKLSIAAALLFAFGTITFAQNQQTTSKQKAATPAAKSSKKAAATSNNKQAASKGAMKADSKGVATPAGQK